MVATVKIEQITSDSYSYRYGKILHLQFLPVAGSDAVVTKVSGLVLKSSDLHVQRHAKFLRVFKGFRREQGAFNLLLGGDAWIEIEITEQDYNELSVVIKENLPPSEEELRAIEREAFFARFPNKKD